MRDLVSPMWRTTWDAHGMVGNLTDVSTGRVYGCSPLPALVFTHDLTVMQVQAGQG